MRTEHDLTARPVAVDDLILHPRNARTHDLPTIEASLRAHGQFVPVVRQLSTGFVIKGNGTVKAARNIGRTHLDVITLDVDDDQATRILLVDNAASAKGGFDDRGIADLLRSLDGDTTGTGYTPTDLSALLASLDRSQPTTPEPHDDAPLAGVVEIPRTTEPGDVWQIGPDLQLMCGDSRNPDDVARLVDGRVVHMAITSPPYADRRTYDETTEFRPIPPDEYVAWFEPVAANVARHLADDGSWFVNIKPGVTSDGDSTELYVLDLVLAHARQWGWNFATEFCWERNGVPKSPRRRFKNAFEPVYQFAHGRWKFRPDNVRHWSTNVPVAGGPGVGDTGWDVRQGTRDIFGAAKVKRRENGTSRTMANVQGANARPGEFITEGLAYPSNRLPTFTATHEAVGHSAAFPVGLPAWFMRAYTDPADLVYEPFSGSGSTLIAAHQNARRCIAVEISPKYCDMALRRLQITTGVTPERNGTPHDFTTPAPVNN